VIAWAGQIASHNLHAVNDQDQLSIIEKNARVCIRTNATLFPTRITPKRMFPAEARGERTLLERIHDSVWGTEELFQD
jgi:hypothetical protein